MNREEAEAKVRIGFGNGLGTMLNTDGTELRMSFKYNTKGTQMSREYLDITERLESKFGDNNFVTSGYSGRGYDSELSIVVKPSVAEEAKQYVLDTLNLAGVQNIDFKQYSYIEYLMDREIEKSQESGCAPSTKRSGDADVEVDPSLGVANTKVSKEK